LGKSIFISAIAAVPIIQSHFLAGSATKIDAPTRRVQWLRLYYLNIILFSRLRGETPYLLYNVYYTDLMDSTMGESGGVLFQNEFRFRLHLAATVEVVAKRC
jgi:hypothetical protein